ncbi:MAG: gamma-glutamyltransferase family protein [Parvularculaceae bacterium]|nr:gamma-glutamyltransferase family protein [Parvularculaceae bacterium]
MNLRHAALFASVLALAACGQQEDTAVTTPPAEVMSPDTPSSVPWIVAAAHPLAVDAGAAILEAGGSAVDAAVAVQTVLGLVEPQSSGLGGGAFMLFYDASAGELIAYDGREQAPASVTPNVFIQENGEPMGFFQAVLSGKAVGVPGAVAMLDLAHREHGELPWSDLFDDAEALARDGFPMPNRLTSTLSRFTQFKADPQAAIYLDKEGTPLPFGALVKNELYADMTAQLAAEGAALFYSGDVAEAIIARVNEKTGEETITLDDFAAYEPVKREAICVDLDKNSVCSMPPPSSGGVTLLQIMEMFEASAGRVSPDDALLEYIEATRLAYADRGRFLGDPISMGTDELTAEELVEALTSDAYLSERAEAIGDAPAVSVEPGNPTGALMLREGRIDGDAYEVPSTSHFSIRDREGNVVSMTSSVEMPFGSQMMAAGMVLNNQLTDFARVPSADGIPAANAPGAGKRPMSSMTPVMVMDENGEPIVAIGSPGGPAIIGYVAKPLINHLFTGTKLSEAIGLPHIVVPRGTLIVEEGGSEVAAAAKDLGYELQERGLTSGLYGFTVYNGEVDLVADPRREGSARMEGQN